MATYGRYKVHAAANIFPLLSKEECALLVEDIRQHGLHHPIVVTADQTTIVDGRNRWLACEEARVDPMFKVLPESFTEADIIAFVESHNLRRRDLNPGQRVALEIELNGLRRKDAAQQRMRGGQGGVLLPPDAGKATGGIAREIAQVAGVGHTVVDQVLVVQKESPQLFERIKAGTVTANDAYKQVRANRLADDTKPKAPTMVVLKTHEGTEVPYPLAASKPMFNRTNEQISWAAWSWNPVTGCLHGCKYCYARELALRPKYRPFYPVGFTPLFHHERLSAPANSVVPDEAKNDSRLGRVFVCSMADLYGKWVPNEWIEQVHKSCIDNPQWEYLMLTKFPRRYVGIDLPKTAWVGTSVDEQKRVRLAEEAFRQIKDVRFKWLSLEPLLAPLQFSDLSMFDWIVIGAQSATEQPDGLVESFAPPFEWVARLVDQAREAGCRIYQKPNLLGIPNPQSPGMGLIQEEPAANRKLRVVNG